MSLQRGKYGVEYTLTPRDDDSRGVGWVFVVLGILALASFGWTLVQRWRTPSDDTPQPAPSGEQSQTAQTAKAKEKSAEPWPEASVKANVYERMPLVRNLLMRLGEAEKRHDVEMAISTIEQLRTLPGSPAADLDDALARRLGTLNMRRLFVAKSAQWVKEVTVRRGIQAERLAFENGATYASLQRLNNGKVAKLAAGQRVYVMDHPRFRLLIHQRSRIADLWLNGKFFHRYDLQSPLAGKEGLYKLQAPANTFWKALGVQFTARDAAEIELLMPTGAPVIISEI